MAGSTSTARHASLRAKAWAIEKALPLWYDAGFDEVWGGFHERLDFAGRPLVHDVPRRVMVQARQIYVFAHADLLGWWPDQKGRVARAVDTMITRFRGVDGRPGLVHSIHADGRVANAARDTYAYAFVLFALGWTLRRGRDARLEALADEIAVELDAQLAAPTGGGFLTQSPPPVNRERLQNPHMHLIEAFLALYESTGKAAWLARAGEIFALLTTRFLAHDPPVLVEYFDAAWQPQPGQRGRLWEPGHHFEWAWLLRRYSHLAGRDAVRPVRALHDIAWAQGRDSIGHIVDECEAGGGHVKASRRCWPHTEALKSLAIEAEHAGGDSAYGERTATVYERLFGTFLSAPVEGGWIDHVGADGKPLVDYMPASTLYHVFLAIAETNRVFVDGR